MGARRDRATVLIVFAVALASIWSGHVAGQGARAAASPPCPTEPARFHPCALERAKTFTPPRTADGKPDLHGFWRGQAAATENIEEHPKTDDDDGGKSLIVDPADGRIPYQPWAAAQVRVNKTKYVEPNVPCFPSGVPRSLYVPTQIEIQQNASAVLILFERAHTSRVLRLDGGAHPGPRIALWQGDSRARWDGNTLVVDVANNNARAWFDQAGNFYTPAARIVERFTLIDPDTIHYAATITDPGAYTRPWTIAFPLRRNKEPGFQLLEEACHEGERNTDVLLRLGYSIYQPARPPAPK